MRITAELRTESVAESHRLAAMPGQRAMLSGGGWSVPVSIRAIGGTGATVTARRSGQYWIRGQRRPAVAAGWRSCRTSARGTLFRLPRDLPDRLAP
jgi:hypothetical protein